MNASRAVAFASKRLADGQILDSYLEAEVLVRHLLGVSRAEFFASLDHPLRRAELDQLERLVAQRVGGEPLAYILGGREFFGLDLIVDRHVLVPRQETELLVELALQWHSRRKSGSSPAEILDLGTGSGAIAVALACSLPAATVYATDVSGAALRIADANRRRHGLRDRVHLIQTDLMRGVSGIVDVVVSNPPYIPAGDIRSLPLEVRCEPTLALDGGIDGLAVTRRLISEARGQIRPGGALIVEVSPDQIRSATAEAASAFPRAAVSAHDDLMGLPRAVAVDVPVT